MMNLAGVNSGVAPVTPVLVATVAVLLAALVAGIVLRRQPGVPALSVGLGIASLYPVATHTPVWLDISDHSAPLVEWPVLGLEIIVAVLIVASVFQARRAWAHHEPHEHEESVR